MRSAFDKLISWTGLLLAVVLLVAGGLLTWANGFIDDQVHSQLTDQGITMPSGDSLDALPEADKAALEEYADSPLDTGSEAKAFADHYILAHMNEGTAGVYEQLEALGIDTSQFPDPMTYQSAGAVNSQIQALTGVSDDVKTEASGIVSQFRTSTLFTGNTLRGLLLYGYAFATIGTIAGIAAIGAYIGGVVFLVLAGIGFWHARKVKIAERGPARPLSVTV